MNGLDKSQLTSIVESVFEGALNTLRDVALRDILTPENDCCNIQILFRVKDSVRRILYEIAIKVLDEDDLEHLPHYFENTGNFDTIEISEADKFRAIDCAVDFVDYLCLNRKTM